jgi:hypothetical protein
LVPQDPFVKDAQVILQCLAKSLNQHNFTIFDARDLMHTLPMQLPLITQEETICELEFLERQRKGIVIGYQNRYKRKASPVKLEMESPSKRPRIELTTSTATRVLLELLSSGPISISKAAENMGAKETLIQKVVDVLLVVGHVTVLNGLISSTPLTPSLPPTCPPSPKSPISSCDDSYGPIPETPPQSMPMWDPSVKDDQSARPYATRFSMRKKQEEKMDTRPLFSLQALQLHAQQRPTVHIHSTSYSVPPPTQPARPRVDVLDRTWGNSPTETMNSFPIDKFSSCRSDLHFDSNLDLADTSIVDLFNNFWDQY